MGGSEQRAAGLLVGVALGSTTGDLNFEPRPPKIPPARAAKTVARASAAAAEAEAAWAAAAAAAERAAAATTKILAIGGEGTDSKFSSPAAR